MFEPRLSDFCHLLTYFLCLLCFSASSSACREAPPASSSGPTPGASRRSDLVMVTGSDRGGRPPSRTAFARHRVPRRGVGAAARSSGRTRMPQALSQRATTPAAGASPPPVATPPPTPLAPAPSRGGGAAARGAEPPGDIHVGRLRKRLPTMARRRSGDRARFPSGGRPAAAGRRRRPPVP